MQLRRNRGRRHRKRADVPDRDRTYGIWGFVTLFVLLALGGLVAVLTTGGTDDSIEIRSPTTLQPTDTTSSTTTTAPATSATLPDGSPAPDGVAEVVVSDGTTSLTFEPPAGLTGPDAAGADPLASYGARVPPTSVTPSADGQGLDVRVGCGGSAEEFLAQLTVTESDASVTVAAVVLVPVDGAPCEVGQSQVVSVPLQRPLAGRSLVVVPPGTDLSGVTGGT